MLLVSGCFSSTCTNDLRGSHRRTVWKWNRSLPLRVWLSRASVFLTRFRVAISSARSVRSFFSIRDRASTRPFVDARGLSITSALGRNSPDTDKILRSPCGTPRRSNQDYARPCDRVKGTHRAGAEPQGFARHKAANQHCRKVKMFLQGTRVHATLFQPGRRTGQRWEPTRAPRQGSKRNEGGPSGLPSFFFCFIPL